MNLSRIKAVIVDKDALAITIRMKENNSWFDIEILAEEEEGEGDLLTYPCPNCGVARIEENFYADRVENCQEDIIDPTQPRLCQKCCADPAAFAKYFGYPIWGDGPNE